jgi:hypothetical protein
MINASEWALDVYDNYSLQLRGEQNYIYIEIVCYRKTLVETIIILKYNNMSKAYLIVGFPRS